MFELNDKVALITGALEGIGRCYANALLANNIKGLALWDINETNAQKVLNELDEKYGSGRTIFIKVDVSDFKQLEDAYEKTVKHFNQLDIVINNAGIIDEKNIQKCLQVNLVAVAVSTNLAINKYIPRYRSGDEGIVLNTSSIAGLANYDFLPTYTVTKHGVVALGRCLGLPAHYALSKVKVLTLCPGITETRILEKFNSLPKELDEMKTITLAQLPHTVQSVDLLGPALIKVLREGKTGSVWVVNSGNPVKEIDYSVADESISSQMR